MKLLVESADFSSVQTLLEEETKNLYIEGIFAQAEKKNRNGRIYPKAVMEASIKTYIDEYVDKKRAIGELSHPENRPKPKPEFASHRVTWLEMDGNDVRGKALVLETPQGQVLRGLLKGGTQMGISTRGLGNVIERSGSTYVEPDYAVMALDAVIDPSGIDCFVDAINESQEWLILDDGRVVESIQKEIKKTKLTEDKKFELLSRFFSSLRG